MTEPTELFKRCRAVYDSLPHRIVGSHGRQVRTRDVKEGDVIGAFLPWQAYPIMELNTDANPDRHYFSLNMPGRDSQVNVFAVPTAWPHKSPVHGATQTEVLHFLHRVEQRRNAGGRTKNREARQAQERWTQ